MWVHRRSEDPSRTEVECYWKTSKLAKTARQYVTVEDFGAIGVEESQNNFMRDVLEEGNKSLSSSQILKYHYDRQPHYDLSLHRIFIKFIETGSSSFEEFFEFAKLQMNEKLCQEAALLTIDQATDSLWHELRYGRITASKIYSAAHCKTATGTFVDQVIGVSKLRDTKAMERGRVLEKQVLGELEKKYGTFQSSGLLLSKVEPLIGASPDAINEDFVVEIKCPSKEKHLKIMSSSRIS